MGPVVQSRGCQSLCHKTCSGFCLILFLTPSTGILFKPFPRALHVYEKQLLTNIYEFSILYLSFFWLLILQRLQEDSSRETSLTCSGLEFLRLKHCLYTCFLLCFYLSLDSFFSRWRRNCTSAGLAPLFTVVWCACLWCAAFNWVGHFQPFPTLGNGWKCGNQQHRQTSATWKSQTLPHFTLPHTTDASGI